MSFRKKFTVSAIGRHKKAVQRANQARWPKILLGGFTFLVGGFLLRKYIFLLVLNILSFIFTPILPDIDDREALYASQSTIIYDREGNELYTIHGDENRFEIPLEKIPESVRLATIAAEDDEFFTHPGFDIDGIIKAALSEIGIGRPRGGSTITQQFVKNAYLSPERSYWRKIQELLLAVKLENRFTKAEILEMYLNRIPYGSNAYGIQAAAQTFFAKNAEELTLAEAVILASLPQAPSRYSPYGQNRDLLTGTCQGAKEIIKKDATAVSETTETLTLQITTTDSVWLQMKTDGKLAKEWTARADEVAEFTFAKNFSVRHGNNKFALKVAEKDLVLSGTGSAPATTSYDRAEIDTLLADDPASVISGSCDSPESPDYITGRKDYVLNRMLELGLITKTEYKEAWQETFSIVFKTYREPIKAPHFVFYVRDKLEERYGTDVVERGGLRVFTTLDPNLQKKAEEIIANYFPHDTDPEDNSTVVWRHNHFGATNASLLAIDNQTGQILTMVGSRDYFEVLREDGYGNDGATNLTTRPRQPGSSFKPFVYTAGFLAGYNPATILWDVETTFGGQYKPNNYDGKFQGPLSIRKAIGRSRNIPAVKMAILTGEKAIVELAHKMGIASIADDERYGPTIGLGAGETPMIEMVTGYSVFANGGKLIKPTPFLKITDPRGNLIDEYETPKDSPQVLDSDAAYLMTHILSDPSSRPEGWNGYLNLSGRPNAAKTGTANKRISANKILPSDVWTIGFTPQITAAAWVGNNDGSPMALTSTGLATASPIWNAFMKYAHQDLPIKNFPISTGIVQRSVSKLTGKIPSDTTPTDQIVVETFAAWAVPLEIDDGFVELVIDQASGKLPTEWTPESAKVKKTFVNLHSERPHDPSWEEPVRQWLAENNEDEDAVYESPPIESDDLHNAQTAKQKPSITIISPVSGSTVQKRSIGIWVEVTASHGVEKVEYYRDGDLVATALSAPWKGVLPISLRAEDGTRVTITAKAYDKLYYADTSTVEVIVGEDTQAPTVQITSPSQGQEIAQGTTLLVKAKAFDAGGDIRKLEFLLDGRTLATLSNPPYETPLIIRDSVRLGAHTLTAITTDTAGFSASDQATFKVVPGSDVADFSIVSPPNNAIIEPGTASVTVTGQLDQAKLEPTVVEFIARNATTGDRTIFATLVNVEGETFSVTWSDYTPGTYELYLKIRDANGNALTSGRNKVEVR